MSDRRHLGASTSRKLRRLRENAGISQYELADLAGLTRPKVKRIEKHEMETVARADLAALLKVLNGAARSKKSSNGAPRRKARTSSSGRTKVTTCSAPPELDEEMQAQVDRRLQESVLDVMRDVIGESGRVLVEKHGLHDVTLGQLFQVDA